MAARVIPPESQGAAGALAGPGAAFLAEYAEACTHRSSSPRVVVLMSTYQGERFVVEQLQSILSQLPPDGRVLVRDDGSSDHTAELIASVRDSRITLVRGQNLGFAASFLTLMMQVPDDADMVMFADQDDVWLPGKIERAWLHLRDHQDEPALYGSAQMLADDALRPLRPTRTWLVSPAFEHALTENMITGCTAALNRPALRLLQRAGVPLGVRFHDWWLYLVVSAFGAVIFDDKPTLLYRQHGGNQIGHGVGRFGRQVQIMRFLLRHDWVGILLGQVDALLAFYGSSLPPPAKQLVHDQFVRRDGRILPSWRMIFGLRRWREDMAMEVALRLLLALYRLHVWPLPFRRL